MKKQVELKKSIKKEEKKKIPEGLNQTFKTSTGKSATLISVLKPTDVWETKGRIVRTIVTHDGVKKIADKAGMSMKVDYAVLTQPNAMNNYQYTMSATICRGKEYVTEIGESNRSNLGTKGRNNPANMTQKRAYDRAVFRLLGITGLLSEEELSDEELTDNMEELSHDEKRHIAPAINQLLLAKTEKDLIVFSNKMKEEAKKLSENEVAYLRKLYRKRVGEIKKMTF